MIRIARPSDVSRMYEIRLEAAKRMKSMGIDQWQDAPPTIEHFERDVHYQRAYVYEENGMVLATATFQLEKEYAYEGVIDLLIPAVTCHRIAVSNLGLRKGIGKALISFMVHYAKSLKISRLYVDTHPMNIPMKRLLQTFDFIYLGDILLHHLRSKERMLFMKTLTF
ncbi:MAG: GNAT family N-acetyltransferase [Acholeplasmataceae bacterium]